MKKIYTLILSAFICLSANAQCPTMTSANAATICSGTNVSIALTANVASTFSWLAASNPYITGASTTAQTTSTISDILTNTTTSAQTVTYTVTPTSTTGTVCTGTAQTINVTVNPLPTATIAGTITVCQGAQAPTITFTGGGTTAPYMFTYSLNGGGNQTVATTAGSNSVTIAEPTNVPGPYTYSLISVQDASSAACSQAQPGGAVITVNALPTASIAGTTTLCQNSVAPTITFTGANSTPPYTFTYSLNGVTQPVITSVGTVATITVPTNTSGPYTFSLISIQDGAANQCAQAQTGGAFVTVNPLPTATIAGTITVCQNSPAPIITFTGGNTTAPYTFTYMLNGVTQPTISSIGNSATLAVPTNTSGPYTFSLISIQDGTANQCAQAQTGGSFVTVNPLPTATIAGTTVVCQNDALPIITFTGSNTTPPYTFTYTINGGGNLTVASGGGSSIASVQVPTATGGSSYNYSMIGVKDGSGAACVSAINGQNAVVNVNKAPVASIVSSQTVCQGDAQPVISFTGGNGIAPYSFIYSINGGASQSVQSTNGNQDSIMASTANPAAFVYQLDSVEYTSGGKMCASPINQSVTIVINPAPFATITGGETVCIGTSLPIITFAGNSGASPYLFIFNVNNGSSTSVQSGANGIVNFPVTTDSMGTFTYSLVSVQDANGCSQQQSGAATVLVNSLHAPSVSILTTNQSATTICNGYLEAVVQGTAPYTYVWSDSTTINSPYRYNECAGMYSVTVTDSTGCSNTAQASIGINSNTVTPTNPLSVVVNPVNVSNAAVCNGIGYVKVTGGTPPYTISFAGNTVTDSVETLTNLCAGFYTVNAVDTDSNTASFTFVVGSPATTYTNVPVANTTPLDTLVTNAIVNCTINYSSIDSIGITNYSYSGIDSINITWVVYQGGGNTYTQQAKYAFLAPGLYVFVIDIYCTLRASGSVVGVDELLVGPRTVDGIELLTEKDVVIYPNPFGNQLTLVVNYPSSVKITDLIGNVVYSGTTNSGTSSVETANLTAGVYLVTITNAQSSVTKKLIKN